MLWVNNRVKTLRKTVGFTLIEVLLALGIFTSLSLAANQVLRNVLNSNEQTQKVGNSLKALQRTISIMDSDFRQVVARAYRNSGQQIPDQMLEIGSGLLESDADGVRFSRGGWINPQQMFGRGEVVKVGYRLRDKHLERLRWVYPDDSPGAEPAVNALLDEVMSLRIAVTSDGSDWSENWDQNNTMPKAIRLTFETQRYGDLERIYLLPDQTLEVEDQSGYGDIQGQNDYEG